MKWTELEWAASTRVYRCLLIGSAGWWLVMNPAGGFYLHAWHQTPPQLPTELHWSDLDEAKAAVEMLYRMQYGG